jgi:phosphatidylglycerol:prolipoprotein diacylglycerol transferase
VPRADHRSAAAAPRQEALLHPVLIDLGGFELHTYGALGAVGFVVLCFLALRDARARGWNADAVVDVIFWTALAAIGGARALFFVQNPGTVSGIGSLLDMRSGGMVFYGAFLGLPVGIGLTVRRGLPLGPMADVFGRLFPMAHGFARLGCLAAGCCYGRETTLPWGVVYTDPAAVAPHGPHLHPVQAYEALGLFAIFGALTWLSSRKRFEGQVLLAYLGSYAVLRFVLETFRGDPDRRFVLEPWLGQALSTSQAIAIAFLAVVVALWPLLARRASVRAVQG